MRALKNPWRYASCDANPAPVLWSRAMCTLLPSPWSARLESPNSCV
uniref:Uncharacterized protein n=1 Tax=Arundo donax TaxID=35708 RepID=A0A0A9EUV7_ARUDO